MEASTGRVLVADDDPILLRTYARTLTAAGYEVLRANDGAEAAQVLRTESVDVIVSDLDMPGLNGIQLLHEVRKRDLDVPVIIVTGGPSLSTAVKALEAGALRYLIKPVENAELLAIVSQAVAMHRLARVRREALASIGERDRQVGDRAGLEVRFTSALDRVWIAFQPIVRWSTREVYAHEALVRSNETSLPHPGALFDAAERLDRLWDLSRRIRREVGKSLDEKPHDALIFVNIHAQDLNDERLFDTDGPLVPVASRIVLEITERASLDQVKDVRGRIAQLRALGFRIALDDMGAGYAGLTSFALLEPDVVKIDMSLTRGVHLAPTKQKLIRAMTELCSSLGQQVVAEGIESVEERDMLAELGCDLQQGFLFARPAPPWPTISWDAAAVAS